jgi:hypothetical protein
MTKYLIVLFFVTYLSLYTNAQVCISHSHAPQISAGAEETFKLQELIKNRQDYGLDLNKTQSFSSVVKSNSNILTIDGIDSDINGSHTGFYPIPPDPSGAAGLDHLVSVVNCSIEWYTKEGVKEYSKRLGAYKDSIGTDCFFEALFPLTTCFDPKVIYDQYNGRFVVATLEVTESPNKTSRILIAVSKTEDPNEGWWFTSINSSISVSSDSCWADYPGLAVSMNSIYITANMFSFSDYNFKGSRLWIIAKGDGNSGLYDGGIPEINVFDPYTITGAEANTYQPAHMFGIPPVNVGTFLVEYSGLTDFTNEYINVITVSASPTSPTFYYQQKVIGDIDNIINQNFLTPSAPQLGSDSLIDVGDRRSINAVWRNDNLWTTFFVLPDSGPDSNQVTAHWLKLNTSILNSIKVLDQGNIGGEDIGPGTFTFYPSVSVNSYDEAIIGFAASGPSIYPGAYFTGIDSNTTVGNVLPSQIFKEGLDYYYRPRGGTRNRWGDYTASCVDPTNDQDFYLYNEYALTRGSIFSNYPSQDGRWGTAFGYVPASYFEQITEINDRVIVGKFNLFQNYPNPFNPSTKISFSVPSEEFVSLKVFNSLGEKVADLVNETKPSGSYSVSFDASSFSSGVYFYRITAGKFVETKKMVLLK